MHPEECERCNQLLKAGYSPEQIYPCPQDPCGCKRYGPIQNCAMAGEWVNLKRLVSGI